MGESNLQTSPGSHLLELTLEAFRVAHRASAAAAEGIATSSKTLFIEVRDHDASWIRLIATSTTW